MAATQGGPLTIADQGGFWVGIERRHVAGSTYAAGAMYVHYQIPAERRHPWPLVLVHGGGGQGLDFLTTPDGRPGWATDFLRRGFAVYVVDRPGMGRSPFHVGLSGPLTPSPSYERLGLRFAAPTHSGAARHTQWPGTGTIGDPALDQFMAAQGAFVADMAAAQEDMRRCGSALLDRIGPAVLLTHSMGGPFGWVVADARPALVRAILAVEPIGPPFADLMIGSLTWGLTAAPMRFDPPVADPAQLRRQKMAAPGPNLEACWLQAEPARRLPNLAGFPIAVVTAEASEMASHNHGVVDFLRQAGADAEHVRLEAAGLHGNGHIMMGERNSTAIAMFLADWIERKVPVEAAAAV